MNLALLFSGSFLMNIEEMPIIIDYFKLHTTICSELGVNKSYDLQLLQWSSIVFSRERNRSMAGVSLHILIEAR